MSKLFANALIKKENLDVEDVREKMKRIPVQMRYVKTNKTFRFNCFNIYLYIKKGELEEERAIISEQDLYKLIKFDQRCTKEDEKHFFANIEMLKREEKGNAELAINHYWAICFIQRYFTLTTNTIKQAKTQYHRYKLKRDDSPWITLMPIPANRHGGRPFGSGKQLSPEEHERLLMNLNNYDRIVKKCVERDFLEQFVELHKDLKKLPVNELPNTLKRRFMKSDAGIKWYFCALRYEYKFEMGIPNKKINPNMGVLSEKCETYDFPFKYKNDSPVLGEMIKNYDVITQEYVKKGQKTEFINYHVAIGQYGKLPLELKFARKGDEKLLEVVFDIMKCGLENKTVKDPDAFRALRWFCTVKNPIFMRYYDLLPKGTQETIEKHEKYREEKKEK